MIRVDGEDEDVDVCGSLIDVNEKERERESLSC
jgi:hypothetical protein